RSSVAARSRGGGSARRSPPSGGRAARTRRGRGSAGGSSKRRAARPGGSRVVESPEPRREARDGDVLVGPRELVPLLVRGVARPVRVVEVAAGQVAEVGAPHGEDAVDVVVR